MIALTVGLLLICPVGTVDQVESGHMAVLGATGVRVVATRSVANRHEHELREGDRIELGVDGRCIARSPDPGLQLRIATRLHQLQR